MICKLCGKVEKNDANFCPNCGRIFDRTQRGKSKLGGLCFFLTSEEDMDALSREYFETAKEPVSPELEAMRRKLMQHLRRKAEAYIERPEISVAAKSGRSYPYICGGCMRVKSDVPGRRCPFCNDGTIVAVKSEE